MKILINAGPTRESIDPVRFISNHSSGKMGYALAQAAVDAGHEVTLVSGPVTLQEPSGLTDFIRITTAAEMADVMKRLFASADLTILCAAVADYRPKIIASSKLKKTAGDMFLELERTEDIALSLGKVKRPDQMLVGFAAETDNVEFNALKKLEAKNFDWIAANRVGIPGNGFASDTNMIKLYCSDGRMLDLGCSAKLELARVMIRTLTEKK